ncbi:MAG: hypothetical protein COS99_08695 [Candidatus Omnitrophica bacterium CG07_land_8_20_14_0_80_42_15]|uniref:Uncharacterized protein n=1 Tax=Candidatus Aquitaenariimonas noxiae TaxID=1974741 RepID=A0A2J0L2Q7_9BACT|nr:MAG: hypothetical protein COS99_08695 [Candidatus Omnitrophica bacterium CG07_land_8_20_14_0_80_42_15]
MNKKNASATVTVEKYALKIFSIANQITEVEKLIEDRKGIRAYSAANTDKIIVDTILKLQNAKIELQAALDCFLKISR